MSRFELRVARGVARSLERLPSPAAAAVVEFMLGPLLDSPSRVGKPLMGEFAGYRSARRGPYRVVYAIDEEKRIVLVVRVDHRADAYRPL